jgi:hypothetical protein
MNREDKILLENYGMSGFEIKRGRGGDWETGRLGDGETWRC